jgi:hypothetical protein
MKDLQALGRRKEPEMGATATAGTDTGQSEKIWGGHNAVSQREHCQPAPGERLAQAVQGSINTLFAISRSAQHLVTQDSTRPRA